MPEMRSPWLHRLHPKRLDPSIGAIAGFASAVSVIVGLLAQNAMGHGWHRAFIALHLAKKGAEIIVTYSNLSKSGAAVAVLEAEGRKAIVCLVGENLRNTPGIAALVFRELADKKIRMISQGASEINLTFVLAQHGRHPPACPGALGTIKNVHYSPEKDVISRMRSRQVAVTAGRRLA